MTGSKLSTKGYFLAIGCVVGGALLMPPFPLFFTTIGLLLLLVSTCILPIAIVGYWRERGHSRGL
jgi:hypothetical protein